MKKQTNIGLDNIDELYNEIDKEKKVINFENKIDKDMFFKEIMDSGDYYIKQSNKKIAKKERDRLNKINYILKKSKIKFEKSELLEEPLEDIESIYTKVLEENKPWYKHVISFLMGWDDHK